MNHTIDATNQSVGRVASKAAVFLLGKNEVGSKKNAVVNVMVTITNASKAALTPKKLLTTMYANYTGFPGGFSEKSMGEIIKRKGHAEIFKQAIYGMIPANKLRSKIMKHVIITE
jgi:large subunit ribosomal protein L13